MRWQQWKCGEFCGDGMGVTIVEVGYIGGGGGDGGEFYGGIRGGAFCGGGQGGVCSGNGVG